VLARYQRFGLIYQADPCLSCHIAGMKHLILAASLAAIPFATPVLAESAYTRECHWEHGRYLCAAEYKSPYSTVTTECAFESNGPSKCETTAKRRPPPEPPRPVLAPTAHKDGRTGIVIMRGMPDR
jgi:hypothetical protein